MNNIDRPSLDASIRFSAGALDRLMARLGALFLITACAPTAAYAAEWRAVSTDSHLGGRVEEQIWETTRSGGSGNDTIRLHRYRSGDPGEQTAAVLYLPGTNMNGGLAAVSEKHSLLLALPLEKIAVYALDYRTHGVGSRDLTDSRFMKDWTSEVFVEDANSALELAARDSGFKHMFVAGFSRGVTLAYAVASQRGGRRDRYAGIVQGLILLDGSFKRAPSFQTDEPTDSTAGLEALESTGAFASDVAAGIGWEARDRLMQAASSNPDGPAVEGPLSELGTVGEQVGRLLYGAWRPGGLTNPIEGGDEGVSRVDVLARLLAGYDRYYPAVQNIDAAVFSTVADAQTSIDDGWGELTIPVINFVSSGMGPEWVLNSVYSAVRSGSPDVTPVLLEGWGHLDVLVSEQSDERVFQPIVRWVEQRSTPKPAR